MPRKSTAEIECTIIRQSEKAILVELANGKEVWIPRSIIPYLSQMPGGKAFLEVEEWWLEKNEIDY
jgi:hypothetical protein